MKTVDTLNGSELNGRSRSRSPRARSKSTESMTKTSTFGTFSANYAWVCPGCRLQNIPERGFCYHCNNKKPVLPNAEETLNTGTLLVFIDQ